MTKLEILQSHLQCHIDQATKAREVWVKRFNLNPLDALTWSQDLFKLEAKAAVAAEVLKGMQESNCTLETIVSYARGRALRGAQFPPSSTSMTSNLVEQSVTMAWAEIYESASSLY